MSLRRRWLAISRWIISMTTCLLLTALRRADFLSYVTAEAAFDFIFWFSVCLILLVFDMVTWVAWTSCRPCSAVPCRVSSRRLLSAIAPCHLVSVRVIRLRVTLGRPGRLRVLPPGDCLGGLPGGDPFKEAGTFGRFYLPPTCASAEFCFLSSHPPIPAIDAYRDLGRCP